MPSEDFDTVTEEELANVDPATLRRYGLAAPRESSATALAPEGNVASKPGGALGTPTGQIVTASALVDAPPATEPLAPPLPHAPLPDTGKPKSILGGHMLEVAIASVGIAAALIFGTSHPGQQAISLTSSGAPSSQHSAAGAVPGAWNEIPAAELRAPRFNVAQEAKLAATTARLDALRASAAKAHAAKVAAAKAAEAARARAAQAAAARASGGSSGATAPGANSPSPVSGSGPSSGSSPAPAPSPGQETPAQLGQQALALVRYPWQNIPGYRIQFLPYADAPSAGFYGDTTFTWGQPGGVSTMYVFPGETVSQLAGITAFEIGHEVDAAYVYPSGGHAAIENALGIHPASWAPNCNCAEQGFLSGWYSAAFSNRWSPGVGQWSNLASTYSIPQGAQPYLNVQP